MRLNRHSNTSSDYRRAKVLRNNASPVERKLWVVLRDQAAEKNLKFRRQHVVHPYIADFARMKARLLIELDGSSHDAKQRYDTQREKFLHSMGYSVLRFSNDEVIHNVQGVVEMILRKAERLLNNPQQSAQSNSPLPNPPRKGEGVQTAPVSR
jgi:very-short-patch-repair endonuclease